MTPHLFGGMLRRVEEFGAYLRSLREARGLSRPQVRDLIRDRFGDDQAFSTSTLENWENGKISGMSASRLAGLVTVLDADYEDVFKRLIIIPNPPQEKS